MMDSYKKYEITVNYEGEDYLITVPDLETANLLNNDSDMRDNYIGQYLHDQQSQKSLTVEKQQQALPESIWSRKTPTDTDNEATKLLLQLRQKYDWKFIDRKHNKSQIWQHIANQLDGHGFVIGINSAERCRQKFANLTKSYMMYIKQQKTTGTGKHINVPPFFEELHSILGTKHKIEPAHLEDSLGTAGYSQTADENEGRNRSTNTSEPSEEIIEISEIEEANENDDITEQARNRFKNVRKRVRPRKSDKVLQELQQIRECRQKEFKLLNNHLDKAEEQRERMLNILEKAFSINSSKTRKFSLPSSSDSN